MINITKPLVSVIIPVYNGSKFLGEAVNSVLKSTYRNFEIILIDDGSTDKSKELCRQLAKKYQRISFYSFAKNKGLGRVLNFALKKARGEFICRINQDDVMYPTRISKQLKFLKSHPDVVLAGSWLLVEEENGQQRINKFLEHDKDIKKTWLQLSPCWDASVIYRKKTALAVGGYDQSYWPADDLHMWYKLGRLGKIANIQEPLVKIKFHKAAASVKHHREHMLATFRVHRFAHNYVSPAPRVVQLFWLCELMAGYLLPARVNWFIYRLIKKYIVYRSALAEKRPIRKSNFLVHSKYAPFHR